MISPDTAPGTEVICIDDSLGPYGKGSLCKGSIYTIELIARAITGGYVVVLLELRPWTTFMPPWGPVDVGFELGRFRYLDIPRELNELLARAPKELETTSIADGRRRTWRCSHCSGGLEYDLRRDRQMASITTV